MSQLVLLDLGNNNIGGPLPPSLSCLTRCAMLYLQHNKFEGELGLGPGKGSAYSPWMPALQRLNVSCNELVGTVSWTALAMALPQVELCDISGNNITGGRARLMFTLASQTDIYCTYENLFPTMVASCSYWRGRGCPKATLAVQRWGPGRWPQLGHQNQRPQTRTKNTHPLERKTYSRYSTLLTSA
jgi:hypothetical protein